MARVQYEDKENAGDKFRVARYGRHAIRIDANRPGVYSWIVTWWGRSVRNGVASGCGFAHYRFQPDRSQAFRDDLSLANLARLEWVLAGHLRASGYEVDDRPPTRLEGE